MFSLKPLFARLPMARSTRAYAFGLAHVPALPEGPVLEIGTGQGYGAAFLSRTLPERQVVAIDITYRCFRPERLVLGPRSPWWIQASAPALPFAAATFALVTLVMTFHCLPEPQKVLAEIARVLRPQGVLLLAEVDGTHWMAPWFERVEHWGGISPLTRAYPPDEIHRLGAQAGLTLLAQQRRKPGGFLVWHIFQRPPAQA